MTKNWCHSQNTVQLLFTFLQRNNGLMRQKLRHKNTSLSNAVYLNAQLGDKHIIIIFAINCMNFVVWTLDNNHAQMLF
jgi:hypothetical protein